jgi:ribosomal protein S18 acetylase RimI-like enzyme
MMNHGSTPDFDLLPASQFPVEQLTEAYNRTRVDYLVPMRMTARHLEDYIHDYDIKLESSAVAMFRSQIVGLCMLGLRGKHAWITRLGVQPNTRRKRVGQGLVEYCLDCARQKSAENVYLEVIEDNAPAHHLFSRLGFQEIRKLLVLRRPPGPPPTKAVMGSSRAAQGDVPAFQWLDHDRAVTLASTQPVLPAWTNRIDTFRNVPRIKALCLGDPQQEEYGWVSYEETPRELRHVMISTDASNPIDPAYRLLHQLHTRFPSLDTLAENIPAESPEVAAFYPRGYTAAYARIEMLLSLAG